MPGAAVAEVIESRHPSWVCGDLVSGLDVGWSEYAVLNPDLSGAAGVYHVPADVPPQAALNLIGMPGLTAYFAMLELCRPVPGDTVVVSAAAGGVGQIAGQLAKLAGCRVIGIVGSADKEDWCRSIGFDAVLNYKSSPNLSVAIRELSPDGVNAFFDGTGGSIHDQVLATLAVGARVAIVGRIAVMNDPSGKDQGVRCSSRLIATRAVVQGFTVFDWWHRRDEAVRRLASLWRAGQIVTREDIADGFEQIPGAFVRMMRGENLGKQIVRVNPL